MKVNGNTAHNNPISASDTPNISITMGRIGAKVIHII